MELKKEVVNYKTEDVFINDLYAKVNDLQSQIYFLEKSLKESKEEIAELRNQLITVEDSAKSTHYAFIKYANDVRNAFKDLALNI